MSDIDRCVVDQAARLSAMFPDVEAPLILEVLQAALADVMRQFPVEFECGNCGAVTRERMAD